MDNNRYPYPPSEALQPPGVRPTHMSDNAANALAQGGAHASTWNTSQMFYPPPTLSRPDNFQGQPIPHLHQFNQSVPRPPIPGFPPPPGLPTPPGLHPPPGSGLNQPTGYHPPPAGLHPPPGSGLPQPARHPPPTGFNPPPGSGLTQPPGLHPLPAGLHPTPGSGLPPPTRPPPPTGLHPPPGSGLTQPTRHPHPIGIHPHPGPGLTPPTGFLPPPGSGLNQPTLPSPSAGIHPHPGLGLALPTGHLPPTGFHSSQGPGVTPPTGFHAPPGSGLSQPPPPPPSGLHSSPGLSPVPSPGPPSFARPNQGPPGVQLLNQKQVHPEVSGRASSFFWEREKFVEPAVKPPPEDEATIQRKADNKWVKEFLEKKGEMSKDKPKSQPYEISISDTKNELYSTAQLVSQLSTLCESLKLNVDNPKEWSSSYEKALTMKQDIQSRLKALSDREHLERMITKLSNIAKRRARRRRARERLQMEEQQREVQKAEKDLAIERWRMKKIQAEEEKKKERELKVAADAVLCDVRKKLTDVKRTQNILKSLEKLRKLRKEAASRKGIHTDPQSDETFNSLLEELREVAKKWTAVYGAEEKVLMVMLEGEQEEERRRELEKRWQRERDKQLRKKRKVQAMLFGDDTPADPLMQPFRQYYTQAEHSLPALVQIRREWDVFLVPADLPEGSAVPQGWVLPDAPSDQGWASALQSSECEEG